MSSTYTKRVKNEENDNENDEKSLNLILKNRNKSSLSLKDAKLKKLESKLNKGEAASVNTNKTLMNKVKKEEFESDNTVVNGMWQNLINNPVSNPTSPGGSSSAQTSYRSPSNPFRFASYAPPIANPFPLAPNDPRNQCQFRGWYQLNSPSTWYQQPPPNSQFSQYRQPLPNLQTHRTPPLAEEEVEDTEPQEVKQKRKQVRWTDEDAQILSERWVHASKDGVIGNSQSEVSHWSTVQAAFNSLVTEKRTISQLTGKWNKISNDVKIFNSIFKRYNENRLSGSRDEDILQVSRDHFKNQQNRKFIYEKCWNVLKGYPKFFFEQGVICKKRTFQPDPEPVNLEDNDVPNTNPIPDPLAANMQRLFQNDLIRRLPRRSLSRKSQRNSGLSDAATSSRSLKEETLELVKKSMEAQQTTINELKDLAQKRLVLEAWSFLAKKIPKGIKKQEKKLLKDVRKNIVNKFSSDFATMFGSGSQQQDEEEDEDVDESKYSE